MKWIKYIIIPCIIGILVLSARDFIQHKLIPHIRAEQIYTKQKAALTTLDFIHPSFESLALFNQGKITLTSDQWSDYINYYTRVTEAVPDLPEAYLLDGYCHFQDQDQEKAIELFEKSVQLNHYFFWGLYDLGIIYTKERRFEEAAQILNFAVNMPPQMALKIMSDSKIYNDIGGAVPDFNKIAMEDLKKTYEAASMLLDINRNLAQNPLDKKTQGLWEAAMASLELQIY